MDILAQFRKADALITDSVKLYDEARKADERGAHVKAERLYAKSEAMHTEGWRMRHEASAAWQEHYRKTYA